VGHLLRRCHDLLDGGGASRATRGAVVFPRRVKALLQESLETRDLRDARQITVSAAKARADALETRMEKLLEPIKSNSCNERLAKHLWKHRGQLFTFLRHPGIDATNYRAEQALRPAVVNRKVWGGNRTEAGAAAPSILMTVLFTAVKQGRDGMEFIGEVLRSMPGQRPMLLAGSG